MKYLIIGQESDLQEDISEFLFERGNICEVVGHVQKARGKIALYEYDIIIIDMDFVKDFGFEIIRLLRQENKNTGLIAISEDGSLKTKIESLDLGADDYLMKPFHIEELDARAKAILRRGKFEGNRMVTYGSIIIDPFKRTSFINRRELTLTKKEFDLLLFFIINKGRVLSMERIAEQIWGDQSDLLDNFNFLYVHINNLKKKLKRMDVDYIRNNYGCGYAFDSA